MRKKLEQGVLNNLRRTKQGNFTTTGFIVFAYILLAGQIYCKSNKEDAKEKDTTIPTLLWGRFG